VSRGVCGGEVGGEGGGGERGSYVAGRGGVGELCNGSDCVGGGRGQGVSLRGVRGVAGINGKKP